MVSYGPRTICSILRTLGLNQFLSFQNYHRVFNRTCWSSHQASEILLKLLVETFAPAGLLVVGIDEALEDVLNLAWCKLADGKATELPERCE